MVALSGTGLKIAIIASSFNDFITKKLHVGALEALREVGTKDEDIHTKDSAMLWFFIAISLVLLAIYAGAKSGGMYAYKNHLFGLK